MKILNSRKMTYLSLGILLVIVIVFGAATFGSVKIFSDTRYAATSIEGEYSVDGKDWQPTLPDVMVHEDFHELTIKGRLTNVPRGDQVLGISATNAWFKLKSNGKVIESNYRADETVFRNTPGYVICYVPADVIGDGMDIELDLVNPYQLLSSKNLSDYFDMYVGTEATIYELLFQNKAGTILFCILICFFGLFSFPIAGIVLGKIDWRYLSFGFLCFFAGIFILMQSIYSYLPLWIHTPVKCMSVVTVSAHVCMISALIYIKVNLNKNANKIIGNIIIVSAALLTALSLVLHFTGVSDLNAGKPFMWIFVGICAIILTVCLITELKTGKESIIMLTSMIPLLGGLFADAVNQFVYYTSIPLFEIGMALTLLNQIVILIIDLHKQYKETIRYQQMQKELYEAKVSLMVSQI